MISLTHPSSDPYIQGQLIEDFRRAPADSVFKVPNGRYCLPGLTDPKTPEHHVKVVGESREGTILIQDTFPSKGTLCGFELYNGAHFENLTLASPQASGLQNMTVGWSIPNPSPQKQTARLINCAIDGHVCAVYVWAGYLNQLIIDSCKITSSRWAVALADSTSKNNCRMDIFDTEIIADFPRYGPGAGHSKVGATICLLASGGYIRMSGGSLTTIGGPTQDVVALAWTALPDNRQLHDQYKGKDWPVIELAGVAKNFNGNGAKESVALYQQIGRIWER